MSPDLWFKCTEHNLIFIYSECKQSLLLGILRAVLLNVELVFVMFETLFLRTVSDSYL